MASFSQGEASILKYEDKVPTYSMTGSAEEADSLQRFNRALLGSALGWDGRLRLLFRNPMSQSGLHLSLMLSETRNHAVSAAAT